jgi:hypothetical protein
MFYLLLLATLGALTCTSIYAYIRTRDPFHPLLLTGPMFAYLYVILPLQLQRSGDLSAFFSEGELYQVQIINLLGVSAFTIACLWVTDRTRWRPGRTARNTLATSPLIWKHVIICAALGMAAWAITIANVGGFYAAFSESKGGGWSDYGYLRDAPLLLVSAVIMCFAVIEPKSMTLTKKALTYAFASPWIVQGALGARRGPTFMIIESLGVAWFVGRNRRPALAATLAAGVLLGTITLLLVHNRAQIFLGSDLQLDTNVANEAFGASAMNEYIYGTGALLNAEREGDYYWGRRILAQFLIRPIPRQLWPNKYEDFGIPELEFNAGTAKRGFASTFYWQVIPGAAPGVISDLWLEFSWGAIPMMGIVGIVVGYTWRKAIRSHRFWAAQYVVMASLSMYFVMQTLEAVIFRFLILSAPIWILWRRSMSHRVGASREIQVLGHSSEALLPHRMPAASLRK